MFFLNYYWHIWLPKNQDENPFNRLPRKIVTILVTISAFLVIVTMQKLYEKLYEEGSLDIEKDLKEVQNLLDQNKF